MDDKSSTALTLLQQALTSSDGSEEAIWTILDDFLMLGIILWRCESYVGTLIAHSKL